MNSKMDNDFYLFKSRNMFYSRSKKINDNFKKNYQISYYDFENHNDFCFNSENIVVNNKLFEIKDLVLYVSNDSTFFPNEFLKVKIKFNQDTKNPQYKGCGEDTTFHLLFKLKKISK